MHADLQGRKRRKVLEGFTDSEEKEKEKWKGKGKGKEKEVFSSKEVTALRMCWRQGCVLGCRSSSWYV